MLYTGRLFTKGSFLILTSSCLILYIHTKCSGFTTGWFGGFSEPTKWIKRKQLCGFGWFWVPTEMWKETAPWTRKLGFSVKVNIYLKPFIRFTSENMNTENEDAAGRNFWIFEILHFKIRKWMEWHHHKKCIPTPHPPTPPRPPLKGQNKRKTQPIHEIKNILTSPENPKFQSLDGTSAICVVLSSALSFSLLVDIYFSSSIDLEEACWMAAPNIHSRHYEGERW